LSQVDKFVFLDDVQLARRSWQVRNRIKTANGELYLTVPVLKTKSRDEQVICGSHMCPEKQWRQKHINSIRFSYKKSGFFHEIISMVEELINADTSDLSTFNINIIKRISRGIGINTNFLKASELKGVSGAKDYRLASICKKIECDEYVSPPGAADYIEKESPGGVFRIEGIKLYYHRYRHPVYPQLYGDFLEYMSIIDLLLNCGLGESLQIIKKGSVEAISSPEFRKNHFNDEESDL